MDTDEGVDRAFAKLDTIKDDIVWWEAGAQPPQLLADGEVAMTTAYNGRIFNAAVGEGQPFEIVWDGQILDFDLWVSRKARQTKKPLWTSSRSRPTRSVWRIRQPGSLTARPAKSSGARGRINSDRQNGNGAAHANGCCEPEQRARQQLRVLG